jgi:hypothetical protein
VRLLRAFAVGAFALTIGVAAWLLISAPGTKKADCATAQQMWALYQSRASAARSAAVESDGDNAATTVKYQDMINDLRAHADRIRTPDIRSRADRMVAINQDMFEQWKHWMAESRTTSAEPATPSSSDKQFGMAFAANTRKLKLVHADLTAACPG